MTSVDQNSTPTQFARWLHLTTAVFLLLIFGLVPFLFTWVNEELFEFNKMIAVYALGGVVISSWLARIIIERKWLIKRSPLDGFILAFLISQVAATILSIEPRTSIWGYYSRFHGGLASTLVYVGIYYATLATFTRQTVKWLWLSFLVGAIGSSLYAFPEHFGNSPSCYLITNGLQGGVDCWIQDVKNRVFGTFGQPNWLAAYLIMALPLAFGWFGNWLTSQKPTPSAHQKWLGTLLLGSTTTLFTLVTLYTKSRSGVAGLAIGLAVWVAIWLLWLFRHPAQNRWRQTVWWLGGCAIVAGVVLIQGSPFNAGLLEKSAPATSPTQSAAPAVDRLTEGGTDSGEIRKIVWEGAVQVWRRYPIFGSGVETFAYSYYQDRPLAHNLVSEWDFLYNKAHNEFLNLLATTGLLGLGTYLALYGCFTVLGVMLAWKKTTSASDITWVASYLAATAALAVSNFFGFSTVMVTVVQFCLFAGMVLLWVTTDPTPHKFISPLSWTQWLGLAGVGLLTGFWLISVRTMWMADFWFSQGKSAIKLGQTQTGVMALEKAATMAPREALFFDELAATYGQVALALAERQESTYSAEFAQAATEYSDLALRLNHRHLNFYKTRARLFIGLSQLDPSYLEQAKESLTLALQLSPTDAKLVYNLALVNLSLGNQTAGLQELQTAIQMKPNYEAARAELARQHIAAGQLSAAQDQLQYILVQINPNNEPIKDLLKQVTASLSAQKK